MLASLEDTGVRGIVSGDVLHQGASTNGMGLLDSAGWHSIRDSIKRQIHVLVEETLEFVTDKESLGGAVLSDTLPDHLLLAVGGLGLVLWSIKVIEMFQVGALLFGSLLSGERFGLKSVNRGGNQGKSQRKFHDDQVR